MDRDNNNTFPDADAWGANFATLRDRFSRVSGRGSKTNTAKPADDYGRYAALDGGLHYPGG